MNRVPLSAAMLAMLFSANHSGHGPTETRLDRLPEAARRSYAQNYKDMVLAFCIAKAYAPDPHAAADSIATAGGLNEWSNYDAERDIEEVNALVGRYLARVYHSIQGPDVKLDLLKCIDMYHGKELQGLVRRYVRTPSRTYQQDNPTADPRTPHR